MPGYQMKEIKIEKYEIIEKIGEGSFADVYLAIDKRLRRKVAIKVKVHLRVMPENPPKMGVRRNESPKHQVIPDNPR